MSGWRVCWAAAVIALWPGAAAWAAMAADDLLCELYQPPRDGVLTVCGGQFGGRGSQITIALAGSAPNRVSEIRLSSGDDATPFQVIRVVARPVIDRETVGILFMDMDFDGDSDLAIMKSLAAGYRYFLYDSATEKFAPSGALDAIAWPEFDPAAKTVRSYVERADGTSWRQTFTWDGDRLRVVEEQ